MFDPSPLSEDSNRRYEQACDQAIAMCDGNLRSTIKALIMANEYPAMGASRATRCRSRARPRNARVRRPRYGAPR